MAKRKHQWRHQQHGKRQQQQRARIRQHIMRGAGARASIVSISSALAQRVSGVARDGRRIKRGEQSCGKTRWRHA